METEPKTLIPNLNKMLTDATAEGLRGLNRTIALKIESSVAQALGFESSWGGQWKVDHCNGRMSAVSHLISEDAQLAAKAAFKKLITPKVVRAAIKEAIPAILEEYKRTLVGHLKEEVHKLAVENAKTIAEALVNNHIKFDPVEGSIDICNPNQSELGKLLLPLIVKRDAHLLSGDPKANPPDGDDGQ